jgi:hypothetical protein
MLRAIAANALWTQVYLDVVAGIRPFTDLDAVVKSGGAGLPLVGTSIRGKASTPLRSYSAAAISETTRKRCLSDGQTYASHSDDEELGRKNHTTGGGRP